METQKKNSDFTEKKGIKVIRKTILSVDFWIFTAVFFALLFLLFVALAILRIELFSESSVNVIKELLIPTLAAVGFAVGFCLTIQRTACIVKESSDKLEHQKNERFRENLTLLNKGNVMAIGAIFNILEDAKRLDSTNENYIKELQKYVSTLCAFLRVTSITDGSSISDLNDDWKGDVDERNIPNQITQRIIELLFPLKKTYRGINSINNDNPFHRNIEKLEIDLSFCNLQKIDLSRRIVRNAYFGGAAMHNSRMYDAKFYNCNFGGTYMQSANLANSKFNSCIFDDSKLVWANLCKAIFFDCNFYKADMSCVLLSKAVFVKDNKFHEAILDGADIYLEKRTDGGNLQPEIFQNPNDLGLKSVKFTFIHPLQNNGKNMVIDTSPDIYEKKPNRLERYITYLKKLEGAEENTLKTNLDTENIRNNKEKLLALCNMALKYAIVDHSTNLSQERYEELTQDLKDLLEKMKQ